MIRNPGTSVADYLSGRCEELEPMEFYRELFYSCSSWDNPIATYDKEEGTYSPLIREITSYVEPIKYANGVVKSGFTKTINVYDGLDEIRQAIEWDETPLNENEMSRLTVINPTIYAGKNAINQNARFLYALVIEIDGIQYKNGEPVGLEYVLKGLNPSQVTMNTLKAPLQPTYIVASGSGVHCYYLFDKPVACFKNTQKDLAEFKHWLTQVLWDRTISTLEDKIQYESVFQGFRMVGTRTKYGTKARAFRTGEVWSLEAFNTYASLHNGPQINASYYKKNNLEECRKKFPKWYERRIVEQQPKGHWICDEGLYKWWLNRYKDVIEGHRYFFIFCLTIYAMKCNIPFERLEEDALNVAHYFDERGKLVNNPFELEDMNAAISNYASKGEGLYTYPIDFISSRSGLPIEKNRRNGRTQKEHLKRARLLRTIADYKGVGAPSKKELVQQWKKDHPGGKKADCCRDLHIDKKTCYKWWD